MDFVVLWARVKHAPGVPRTQLEQVGTGFGNWPGSAAIRLPLLWEEDGGVELLLTRTNSGWTEIGALKGKQGSNPICPQSCVLYQNPCPEIPPSACGSHRRTRVIPFCPVEMTLVISLAPIRSLRNCTALSQMKHLSFTVASATNKSTALRIFLLA